MTISAPNIEFDSRDATSITVVHNEPTEFVAPSTAFVKSTITAHGSKGDTVSVETITSGLVTIPGLAGEQTYRVTASALSDADEQAVSPDILLVVVTANSVTDTLSSRFRSDAIPGVDDRVMLSHEAVAWFLDGLGFELSDLTKVMVGENCAVDIFPREYYDDDKILVTTPDQVLVLLENEPVFNTNLAESKAQKTNAVVSITVMSGNRDFAARDITRLYRFFQRREYVQWSACDIAVHSAVPVTEPVFVGVEINGLARYSLRLALQYVIKSAC